MVAQTVWNILDIGRTGYWGTSTSSIDWCELNYQYTFYLAELYNSLSNAGFVALAGIGIYHDIQQRLPIRFLLAHIGLTTIGLGSFAFHSTLLWELQMMDELPMILVSSIFTFIVFDLSPLVEKRSNLKRRSISYYFTTRDQLYSALGLALFNIMFVVAYLKFPNPVFHQLAFGILSAVTLLQGIRVLYFATNLTTSHATKQNAEARKLQMIGASLFIFAFFCWNIDNIFCYEISKLKAQIWSPLSFFFELHAIWHLLVGLGVFYVIASVEYATLSVRDKPENYEILYSLGFLPYVSRTILGWKYFNSNISEVNERSSLLTSRR